MNTKTIMFAFLLGVVLLPRAASGFYNPQTGKWLSRDPIGEQGGDSLNVFAQNNPAAGETLYTNPQPGETRSTTRIILSKCEYDFDKLNACLGRKAAAAKAAGRSPLQCGAFVDKILSECQEESKGCTSR
jgi:hypothetical protein